MTLLVSYRRNDLWKVVCEAVVGVRKCNGNVANFLTVLRSLLS